jgi:hypothetical protein
MSRSIIVLAAAITLVACSSDATAPIDPSFARAPKESAPVATWHIPLNDAGLSLRSDGRYASNGFSAYAHGVCAVSTLMNTAATANGNANITLDSSRKCQRAFTLVYPDGGTETLRSFINLIGLHKDGAYIPVGTTELRTMAINPDYIGVASRCGRLLFGEGTSGAGVGSDQVFVTRVNARTWHVQSQPENRKAWCEKDGEFYDMPVDLLVVADRDLAG